MTYDDFQGIYVVSGLNAWENDFYVGFFDAPITEQEFFTKAHEKIEGLANIYYRIIGSSVYFIVPKGTVIPEGFAAAVDVITNVPTEAPAE